MDTKTVKNPVHYTRWKIQPIEFIRANNLDFARANIIKYIMRHDVKDGIKDLDKAQQYMDWLREDFLNKQLREFVTSGSTPWEVQFAEKALYDGKDGGA